MTNGICQSCLRSEKLPNCQTCTSLDKCDICKPHFYLDSYNLCGECTTNCSSCSIRKGDASATCGTCYPGYFAVSNTHCTQCGDKNCNYCTKDKCISCKASYGMNNSVCATCFLNNCQNCTFKGDQPICTSCAGTTFLLNGECIDKYQQSCV